MKDWFRKRLKRLMQDPDAWIKKVVPAEIRHKISKPLEGVAVPQTKKPKPYEPGRYPAGINLYGLLRAEMGLAQGAKLYARALEEGGIPHTLLNLDFVEGLPQSDRSFDGQLTVENKYAINVVHINPMEWRYALGTFPQAQFDRHYNIGVFLWELEKIPEEWKRVFSYMDEIWTPSGFIANAIRKETGKPVTVIPYGMEAAYDEGLTRADFGLSEEDFLVLMMFDSKSSASRKNPGGAIDGAREAGDQDQQPEGRGHRLRGRAHRRDGRVYADHGADGEEEAEQLDPAVRRVHQPAPGRRVRPGDGGSDDAGDAVRGDELEREHGVHERRDGVHGRV